MGELEMRRKLLLLTAEWKRLSETLEGEFFYIYKACATEVEKILFEESEG